jgi:regulatory protein
MFYVERYGGCSQALRRALGRRLARSARGVTPDRATERAWIEDIIARLQHTGLLDDREWAASRARHLNARGIPQRVIEARLRGRDIEEVLIGEALRGLHDEDSPDPDERAAWAYARRRRLGPFRPPDQRELRREKDRAAMLRAGFSYRLVAGILGREGVEPP